MLSIAYREVCKMVEHLKFTLDPLDALEQLLPIMADAWATRKTYVSLFGLYRALPRSPDEAKTATWVNWKHGFDDLRAGRLSDGTQTVPVDGFTALVLTALEAKFCEVVHGDWLLAGAGYEEAAKLAEQWIEQEMLLAWGKNISNKENILDWGLARLELYSQKVPVILLLDCAADAYSRVGEWERAVDVFRQALQLARAIPSDADRTIIPREDYICHISLSLADTLIARGDWNGAEEVYREVSDALYFAVPAKGNRVC